VKTEPEEMVVILILLNYERLCRRAVTETNLLFSWRDRTENTQ
jgi:hypothetical protein